MATLAFRHTGLAGRSPYKGKCRNIPRKCTWALCAQVHLYYRLWRG